MSRTAQPAYAGTGAGRVRASSSHSEAGCGYSAGSRVTLIELMQ